MRTKRLRTKPQHETNSAHKTSQHVSGSPSQHVSGAPSEHISGAPRQHVSGAPSQHVSGAPIQRAHEIAHTPTKRATIFNKQKHKHSNAQDTNVALAAK